VLIDGQDLASGRNLIANPGKGMLPPIPAGEYTARLIAGSDTVRTTVLVLR
jgi:hypothetical protein